MGKDHQAVFGIFDGHSGAKAAQFWKETLSEKLQTNYKDLQQNTWQTVERSKTTIFTIIAIILK